MALFPVVRYMGEEEEEEEGGGGIKTVMTLEELHRIARQRINNKETVKADESTEETHKGDLKVEEDRKHKRRKKKYDKEDDIHDMQDVLKKCSSSEEVNETSSTTPTEHPLPLVTHTKSYQVSSLHHYQLPDWVIQYNHIEMDIAVHSQPLDSFSLDDVIISNLLKMGITSFFPVQCKVIPELMTSSRGPLLTTVSGASPSDVCVCAPTGCGKTLSYVVPIVSILMSRTARYLRALIVVPSKDLALQVYKVCLAISKGTRVRIGLVCSHNNLQVEQEQLVSSLGSEVDVLVATPGRLVTHLQETPFFSLVHLRYLVIDEADRIFEQTYHDWLSHVLQASIDVPLRSCSLLTSSIPRLLPSLWKPSMLSNETTLSMTPRSSHSTFCTQDILQPVRPLQKLLFSATLSLNPEHLSLLQLHRPKLFTVAPATHEQLGESVLPSSLKEYSIQCTSNHKPLVLLHLIHTLGHQGVLCFTHSRESTHRLTLVLQQYQAPVAEISAASSQGKKNEIIKKFKKGKLKVKNQ